MALYEVQMYQEDTFFQSGVGGSEPAFSIRVEAPGAGKAQDLAALYGSGFVPYGASKVTEWHPRCCAESDSEEGELVNRIADLETDKAELRLCLEEADRQNIQKTHALDEMRSVAKQALTSNAHLTMAIAEKL